MGGGCAQLILAEHLNIVILKCSSDKNYKVQDLSKIVFVLHLTISFHVLKNSQRNFVLFFEIFHEIILRIIIGNFFSEYS